VYMSFIFWVVDLAIKFVLDCGSPAPVNGLYSGNTTLGETAKLSCKVGYTFAGATDVTCTASGWSDNATCTIKGSYAVKH
jgi:hypothetical protein